MIFELFNEPWLIKEREYVNLITAFAASTSGNEKMLNESLEKFENRGNVKRERLVDKNGIAWIPINGVIYNNAPFNHQIFTEIGGTYTTELNVMLQESIDDPKTKAIVFSIDSPGGEAYGIHELATSINQASEKKQVYSYIRGEASSAAMYLAAAAGKGNVYAESKGSTVGNLGVVRMQKDISKMLENMGVKIELIKAGDEKVTGNPFEPLSDEARAKLQSRVDTIYNTMNTDVAQFRGVSKEDAHSKMMNGRTFLGSEALSVGLVDAIAGKSKFENMVVQNIKKQNKPTTKPKGGGQMQMTIEELTAQTGGQELIYTLKSESFAEGRLVGVKEGQEKAALLIAEAQVTGIDQAVSTERERIKSVLSLIKRFPHHAAAINTFAYSDNKDERLERGEAAYRLVELDSEKTQAESNKILSAVTNPVPGNGGRVLEDSKTDSLQSALDVKVNTLIEKAEALMAEKPAKFKTVKDAIVYITKNGGA